VTTNDTVKKNAPIEGLVAGILTERELAINIGSEHGVESGMAFQVMANAATEITDPKTGEVLGSITREKVRVRATRVAPRFSICKTYQVHTTPGGILGGTAATALANVFERSREFPETLKAEDAAYLPDLPEEDSFVKKEDRVIQLLDED
jgi:hypothetical protein